MDTYRAKLHISRLLSKASALFCIFTTLCILDALQTLVRHEYNQIDIIAGEEVYITGNMPLGATQIEEIVLHVEGYTDLRLELTESFSGFWFGGKMWRAKIYAPTSAINTKATLVVEDIREEEDRAGNAVLRQNPMLLFPIYIWKDATAKNAADNSFFVRYTGLRPFILGIAGALAALAFAVFQWATFRAVDKALVNKDIYFIHGIKKEGNTYQVMFVLPAKKHIEERTPIIIMDHSLVQQGYGEILACAPGNATAVTSGGLVPKYGWFLCSAENFKKFGNCS